MDVSHLSLAQRLKRRWKLMGSSYTHPDGYIELDFEAPAGIDRRTDSSEVQAQKLSAYENRQRASRTNYFYFIAGAGLMYLYFKYL